jgi:hypothetical protein
VVDELIDVVDGDDAVGNELVVEMVLEINETTDDNVEIDVDENDSIDEELLVIVDIIGVKSDEVAARILLEIKMVDNNNGELDIGAASVLFDLLEIVNEIVVGRLDSVVDIVLDVREINGTDDVESISDDNVEYDNISVVEKLLGIKDVVNVDESVVNVLLSVVLSVVDFSSEDDVDDTGFNVENSINVDLDDDDDSVVDELLKSKDAVEVVDNIDT